MLRCELQTGGEPYGPNSALSPFGVICNPPPKDLEQTSILYQCLPLHLQLAICNGQNLEDLIFWIYTKGGSAPLWLLGLVPGARLNKRALILSNCHNKYVATTDTRHSLKYANLQIMWTVAPFRCFRYSHPVNRDSTCSFVRRESMLYLALHELCNLYGYGQSDRHNILSFRYTVCESSSPVHRIMMALLAARLGHQIDLVLKFTIFNCQTIQGDWFLLTIW